MQAATLARNLGLPDVSVIELGVAGGNGLVELERLSKMTSSPVLMHQQLDRYRRDGYLFPIRVMTEQQAAGLRRAVDEHLEKHIESERYELTDPVIVRRVEQPGGSVLEYDEDNATEDPVTFPFLFNL